MRIWNASFLTSLHFSFVLFTFIVKTRFLSVQIGLFPRLEFSSGLKKGQSPRVASARRVQYQRPCFDWRKFTVFGNFSVNKKTLCRIDTLQFGKSSRFLRFSIVVSELGITCDFVLIFYDRKKNFEQLGMIQILINFLGILIDSATKGWLTSDF